MIQTVSITNLRNNIFDIFSGVEERGDEIVIVKNGKKVAVIGKYVKEKIDWDKYEKELEEGVKYLRKVGWRENKDFRKNFKFRKW